MTTIDLTTKWAATGVKFKTANIIVAPEPFVPSRDIQLESNRRVLKGTKYMPLATAIDLIRAEETPAGWRLPSREEGQKIAKLFTGTEIGRKVFGLDGYVGLNDMARYQHSLAVEVMQHGAFGYCWTSDFVSELYAYVIISGKRVLNADSYLHIGCGLPLMLVKDL